MCSASTFEIGPPHMEITWGFLTNIVILTTQYAMPFERLGRLASTYDKAFSSTAMYRYFSYAAKKLAPIYLCLAEQLAQSELLSGDDTTVRVIEANRAIQENTSTWEHYATPQAASDTLKNAPDYSFLDAILAANLGFEFPKKTGEGAKKQIRTTTLWGKTSQESTSYIIFYRSHFGNFGNLLDTILMERSISNKNILIQSDLSTANLISNTSLLNHFNITQCGCASHARRPFAMYENEDHLCAAILTEFRILYHSEKGLDLYGRNYDKAREIREKFQKPTWENILEYSHKLTTRWSPATPIGTGARYIIKHYEKLTAYIQNPVVPLTNDLSERMLRMEKLIQANSLFRNSLNGRFALDICRTIVQTSIAAGVNLKDYLLYVLKQKDTSSNPAQLTPYAFSKLDE